MPNARFWVYINGDYVKLTLREGDTLAWGKRERTEEGWASESVVYSFKEGFVIREVGTDGRDCDGRFSSWHADSCPVDLLRAIPTVHSVVGEIPALLPAWDEYRTCDQRDYTAESMGY